MDIKFKYYPGFKKKAVTMSYDDGRDFDIRLAQIFDRNGIKGTFHINSSRIDNNGCLSLEDIKNLNKTHEITCHTINHYMLNNIPKSEVVKEILDDRKRLEEILKQPVWGLSYPYGVYDDSIVTLLQSLNIKYSRTVESTGNFKLPSDFLKWHPTCHHNNADDYVDSFLGLYEAYLMPLLYIWGHSFEFDKNNNWDIIEKVCEKLSYKENIWYATNKEIYIYITALRGLVFSVDNTSVYNPSAETVYIEANHKPISVPPGITKLI